MAWTSVCFIPSLTRSAAAVLTGHGSGLTNAHRTPASTRATASSATRTFLLDFALPAVLGQAEAPPAEHREGEEGPVAAAGPLVSGRHGSAGGQQQGVGGKAGELPTRHVAVSLQGGRAGRLPALRQPHRHTQVAEAVPLPGRG